jgi:hypothetical protein
MPTYIKYRGAAKVPARRVGTKGKGTAKKALMMPRKDWINPGEHVPVTRSFDKVYHQTAPIPRRKK